MFREFGTILSNSSIKPRTEHYLLTKSKPFDSRSIFEVDLFSHPIEIDVLRRTSRRASAAPIHTWYAGPKRSMSIMSLHIGNGPNRFGSRIVLVFPLALGSTGTTISTSKDSSTVSCQEGAAGSRVLRYCWLWSVSFVLEETWHSGLDLGKWDGFNWSRSSLHCITVIYKSLFKS